MSASKPPTIFCNTPDEGDRGMKYAIVRTPPKGLKGAIVTSHDPLGMYTHWHGGRTSPHVGTPCELCDANVSKRWYGYLMIYSIKQARQFLFEYTGSPAESVVEYWVQHRTLRGARLIAERQGARANGRLSLFLHAPAPGAEPLPIAPNRVLLLSQMWQVPLNDFLSPDDPQRFDQAAPPNQPTEPTKNTVQ